MDRKPQHVMVAVDSAGQSCRAVSLAGQLASAFNANLTVLHIVSLHQAQAQGLQETDGNARQLLLERLAKPALDKAFAVLEELGLHKVAGQLAIPGDPGACIVEAVRSKQVDMLVLGHSGHGSLEHFLGSRTMAQVVRQVECPVTLVR